MAAPATKSHVQEKTPGVFRVWIRIPTHLQGIIGKKQFIHNLGRMPENKARCLGYPIAEDFLRQIEAARGGTFKKPIGFRFWAPGVVEENGLTIPETIHTGDQDAAEWIARRRDALRKELAELENDSPTQTAPMALTSGPVSAATVIETWKLHSGNTNPKTLRSYPRRFQALLAFLKIDDVSAVTRDGVAAYRLDLMQKGSEKHTIQNHLGIFASIFNAACEHRVLKGENPMKGIKIGKTSKGKKHVYSDEQRAIVLIEGRKQAPEIRYPSLIAAFTGARIGEIIDCTTLDIRNIDGIWCIKISEDNREEGQTLKTEGSERIVPLHSQIIAEGFLEYVQSLPQGPLFPQFEKDRDGARKENGGKKIRPWIRSLGITDPLIKPMHAFRDYVQTFYENHATDIPLKTRCAITGHSLDGEVFNYVHVEIVAMQKAVERLPNPLA